MHQEHLSRSSTDPNNRLGYVYVVSGLLMKYVCIVWMPSHSFIVGGGCHLQSSPLALSEEEKTRGEKERRRWEENWRRREEGTTRREAWVRETSHTVFKWGKRWWWGPCVGMDAHVSKKLLWSVYPGRHVLRFILIVCCSARGKQWRQWDGGEVKCRGAEGTKAGRKRDTCTRCDEGVS